MIPSLPDRLLAPNAPVLVLDGALGTQLMSSPGERPSLLSRSAPDRVRALHEAYFAAGADAVHTNTFVATRADGELSPADVRAINLGACLLAREVRPEGRWVLGDVSPPLRSPDPLTLRDAYAEQLSILGEGGVDALHLETMYEPFALRAALDAASRATPRLPLLVSFAVQVGGESSIDGTPLAELVRETKGHPQVIALGLNCSLTPSRMVAAFVAARALDPRFLLVQPVGADPPAPPLSPADFVAQLLPARALGARGLGGCCGSTPEHIRALAGALAAVTA